MGVPPHYPPPHAYSSYGYYPGPPPGSHVGPPTHYYKDYQHAHEGNSKHQTDNPKDQRKALSKLEAKSEFVGKQGHPNKPDPGHRNPQNQARPQEEPQVLFEKSTPNLDNFNFEHLSPNSKPGNGSIKKSPILQEELQAVPEEQLDNNGNAVETNEFTQEGQSLSPEGKNIIKPQKIFSKFSGMKYNNFQADTKPGQPMTLEESNKLNENASLRPSGNLWDDQSEDITTWRATSEVIGINQMNPAQAPVPVQAPVQIKSKPKSENIAEQKRLRSPTRKQNGALEGFQPQRNLAYETMTVVAPSISKYSEVEDNTPAKSDILNAGINNRNTDTTLDLGRPDNFQTQPQRRISSISKNKSNEESSVHARDTDDILKFSQNDTRELFDIDNDLGNITELCDAENLSFQRELKSGTFQSSKNRVKHEKHKTDGFLVSNLDIEEEDDDDPYSIGNLDARRRPGGGSENFHVYSRKKGHEDEGDFNLNNISEVDTINEVSHKEESMKDLKFSDDEDDSDNGDGDRRRAVEVDFDF